MSRAGQTMNVNHRHGDQCV